MKFLYALVSLATLSLLSTSCSKKKERVPEMTPSVDVAQVIEDSVLLSKKYPGTAVAAYNTNVVCRVSGTLQKQLYQNGDFVRKGQPLFAIEDTKYRDAVEQAEAALANAQSEYEYNSKNYAAMQKALESDAVAQIQVLESKSNLEQSEAAVKNAKAALETARTNLGYCTITAPFDGNVSAANFSPGTYISGEGAPVTMTTIYDNSTLNCDFFIEDASFIKAFSNENNRTKIDYDNVPVSFTEQLPHSYAGKLVYISPDVDISTGTLRLRVVVNNPYNELRSGMYCTISLPVKLDQKAILIKDAAIASSQTNKYVYVVNDSNRVVFTPIEVGDQVFDTMRVVTHGLVPGEKYVTKALLKVRPGMEVRPVLTK